MNALFKDNQNKKNYFIRKLESTRCAGTVYPSEEEAEDNIVGWENWIWGYFWGGRNYIPFRSVLWRMDRQTWNLK